MKYYITDFENNLVICEDQNGDVITFPMNMVEDNGEVGDIIYYDPQRDKYIVDIEETKSRQKYISELMDDVFE